MSLKQIRYLYAIGVFKGKMSDRIAGKKSVSGAKLVRATTSHPSFRALQKDINQLKEDIRLGQNSPRPLPRKVNGRVFVAERTGKHRDEIEITDSLSRTVVKSVKEAADLGIRVRQGKKKKKSSVQKIPQVKNDDGISEDMRAGDEFKKHLAKSDSIQKALETVPPHIMKLLQRELAAAGKKDGYEKPETFIGDLLDSVARRSGDKNFNPDGLKYLVQDEFTDIKMKYNRSLKRAAKNATSIGKMDVLDTIPDIPTFPTKMTSGDGETFLRTQLSSDVQIGEKHPEIGEAFKTYQKGDYLALNRASRKSSRSAKFGDTIDKLDEGFSHVKPLPEDITVFRGVSKSFSDKLTEQHREGKLLGSSITGGYISATTDAYIADEFASYENAYEPVPSKRGFRIEILAPKGSKAIHLEGKESELLFPRTSSLEIVGVDTKTRRLLARLREK